MRKRLASLTAVVVLACSVLTSASTVATFYQSSEIVITTNATTSNENNAQANDETVSVEGIELDKSAANNVNVNGTMMQYFEWNLPDNGTLWNQVADQADELADIGITALWLPRLLRRELHSC